MEQKLRKAADALPEATISAETLLEMKEQKKPGTVNLRRRWAAVACCVLLVLLISLGGYACAAEVAEYKDATQFFAIYGLSTEGLTRGEIKAVYRDITSSTFTYSKTAEVLEKTLCVNMVPGFELIQGNPTPEEIERVWDEAFYNGTYWVSDPKTAGISYKSNMPEDPNGSLPLNYMEKYDGGSLVWSVPVDEFWITGYTVVSDGVIAYGQPDPGLNSRQECGWFTKIDKDGNRLWTRRLQDSFEIVSADAVLENDDGSYAVISRGDLKYLCFYRYSRDGELLNSQRTEIGNYGIWDAARLGEGYLVQLGNYMSNEFARLGRLDARGNLLEVYTYTGEETMYYITDMMEYGEDVYLSAYAVPIPKSQGSRAEISDILNQIFENEEFHISPEKLTPMMQEHYTAVLLKCEENTVTPQKFYQVKGALGGQLSVDEEGRLNWAVETITETSFSPATSAFSIRGTCHIYRYTFDAAGKLLHSTKTGERTPFYR